MNNPNLQQLPSRDPELGPMIRRLFLPEEGRQWAAIDFSQQEPRIMTHYAKVFSDFRKEMMPGLDAFVKEYQDNPKADFHSMVAQMAGIDRKRGKTISLALLYGMGVKKLAVELGISDEDAKQLTADYHEKVPFVKMLTKGVQKRLEDPRSSGSIRSIKGRKCRFDLWEPATFEMHKALPKEEAIAAHGPTTRLKRSYTYKALNRLIQASAADMTKQAMVDVCEAGDIPLLQIHDELAFSVENKRHAEMLAQIMENAVELTVPNHCDIEMGPSWGETVEN
jgi:DNA polymerase I-like protein with 3'-5' exonuclease and polymerase domains